MISQIHVMGDQVADVTLPGACMVCKGEVALRMTGMSAALVCLSCHLITHPKVEVGTDSVRLDYRPRALV